MDISGIKKVDIPNFENRVQKLSATDKNVEMANVKDVKKSKEDQSFEPEQLNSAIDKMNKAMAALNTSLQFAIHEDTDMMMVQMVDMKDKTVLKEFPPREFLDTISKIRNMIGIFLDARV
ncbi:flagellar protein FlaG [Heliorestis acidaminivorans]|uniref:Flagellar protein FlaG n=1 Tax=Heliorestis acidaminivorans TaxID=553427 RepID=A0A6I0F7Z6_9FIRM|nr:flagellar protein FlaG [Heliorestis acidaminivorans]KAB2953618.1 flagellar protein FlaG [Heliorestis acidaminivorans]